MVQSNVALTLQFGHQWHLHSEDPTAHLLVYIALFTYEK